MLKPVLSTSTDAVPLDFVLKKRLNSKERLSIDTAFDPP
jgi:hypothetical protein